MGRERRFGRIWRSWLIGALAGTGLLSLAAPARATEYAVTCTIDGTMYAVVSLQGGTGTYAFTSSDSPCAAVGADGSSATLDLDIDSSGTFTNSVCGTGTWATWSSSVTATGAGPSGAVESAIESSSLVNYMDFTAGHGFVTFQNVPGTGVIQIQPDGSQSAPTCTASFHVRAQVEFEVTGDPSAGPPQGTAPPVVLGAPVQGQTLQATEGTWSGTPTSFGYQWLRCNLTGDSCSWTGVTSATYALGAADVGRTMRVEVTAYNSSGSSSPQRSVQTAPVQQDPTGILAPGDPDPPPTTPSSTCEAQGGTRLADEHLLGTYHLWAYVWQPAGRVNVCVRVEAGAQSAGGRLEVDSGSSGVTPVVRADQTDLSPCTQPVHESGTLGDRIDITPVGANPVSICITAAGTTKRIDVGTSGSAVLPRVNWTPDAGTPLPETHIP